MTEWFDSIFDDDFLTTEAVVVSDHSEIPVRGSFGRGWDLSPIGSGGLAQVARQAFTCRSQDVVGVKSGQWLRVNGKDYAIREVCDDGRFLTELRLSR